MLPACPDCGANLGRDAKKCRCGWKAAIELPRLSVQCAYEGCKTPAICREKLETGWANLCEAHMLKEHTKRAVKWCESQGLYTRDQKIEYCRKMAKKMGLNMKFPEPREPGCDDEPKHYMPGVEAKPVAP